MAAVLLVALLTAGWADRTQAVSARDTTTAHQHTAAGHQHDETSPTDIFLLCADAVLVVVAVGLVLRPSRVRADRRWRLPEADRRPLDDEEERQRG